MSQMSIFRKADVLSQTMTATIDVGRIENKETYEYYLKSHGFEVTKETDTIWAVKATQ
ncbi:hypothetical protein [His 1 virus]|uniref:Uncharacterized protein ORF9 n=1 Tax=His1 virus (isolate Australia/Victoria) TaxID=654912 RepID=Y009_HIS1I|nr:hypothetical protein His1V_gp09 [His 1 virus]Q25BI6.1 RecName: Full=Uncharacterized protein ORF9 [His1 virus (isolate Victoria)]AAQ13722.1 hypothetical protein [His 1 virus]